MTASLQRNLAQTIVNLIKEAKSLGLNATKPVKLKLMGSTIQGDLAAPERFVTISFATPPAFQETQLWVNPTNRLMFKSDPVELKWYQILQYSDMFSPFNAFAGDEGAGGHSGNSGSSSAAGQPVQSITELQVLTDTPDKTLIYVENERAIYAYDANSIDIGPGVIVPSNGVGRWLLVSNTSGTITNLDGGFF